MKRFLLLAVLVALFGDAAAQQVTGLSGWNPYLDPGHSQRENMGVEGWSEAEHSVRVSNYLRAMLMNETDVDTVYVSRTNDQQSVGLSQRSTHANQVGADFFYSIHSDAGAPSANSTLMLYGGWRANCQTVEKTPHGGQLYGDILDVVLTRALRIGFRGNYADRTFYQGFPCDHANQWPYLSVNRLSNMASLLSEAGFHTNPTHNMRQMNSEFQKMQARAAYWSFLDYHEIERPTNRVLGGYVTDVESGRYLNGATITIGGQTYTTDTFESLFHRFTNDPNRLANGFYYLEELPEGELEIVVEAPGYATLTTTVTPERAEFSFFDAALVSTIPPRVASTNPAQGLEGHRFVDPIVINFSRRMDRASTEAAFSIEPEVEGSFLWSNNDFTLTFRPAEHLDTQTEYTVRIAETARGHYDDPFDGDGDGTGGGEFVLAFTTSAADVTPPVLQTFYPAINAQNVERLPIVTLRYDEPLNPETVTPERVRLEKVSGSVEVDGTLEYYRVGERGVIQFFPAQELEPLTEYRLVVTAGIEDIFGNATAAGGQIRFTTDNLERTITTIDDFEGNFTANWWHPTQSGSTAGHVADSTLRFVEEDITNVLTGSDRAMGIQYGWDSEAGTTLSRTHLGGGTPRTVTFDRSVKMQAYVFGDGSNNEIRFGIRSSSNSIAVGPWQRIDWHGWRLVSWDLETDALIDFHLSDHTPPFFAESIQLRRGTNGAQFGSVIIDDLRIVTTQDLSVSAPIAGDLPTQFVLHQNYPNPFNPTTTIPFEVPQNGQVSIRIYDVLGKEVATLIDGDMASGRHEVSWNANDLPSGVYFARMDAGSATHSVKLVLLK